LPSKEAYRDIAVEPNVETMPGLLIFRFDAPVIFANAAYFVATVRRLIAEATEPVRVVLIPAQQINHLDSTGADQLARLGAELNAKGIRVSFAEVKHAVRETMHRTGLEEKIGTENFYESVTDGVESFVLGQRDRSGE
jgi:SulP family sulfate permease